jgi:hypothetical protein
MLAHAFLAITAATAPTTTGPPQLIALTANEIRHLFTRLLDHGRHEVALRLPPETGHRVSCDEGDALTVADVGFIGCSVAEC